MEQESSKTSYNYKTIKITQSRIDKNLLVIPRSFASEYFPDENSVIKILFDNDIKPVEKNYVSFKSSATEARIGGLTIWLRKNQIKADDEIIIQPIDVQNLIYRIIPEKLYLEIHKKLTDNIEDINCQEDLIEKISKINDVKNEEVVKKEFLRLSKKPNEDLRKSIIRKQTIVNDVAPPNIRRLLEIVYVGKCQVCNFGFLKIDNTPYYEIHHINSILGNHLKNLLLICANCHRQFHYANTKMINNSEDWLVKVSFNDNLNSVNQYLLKLPTIESAYKFIYE